MTLDTLLIILASGSLATLMYVYIGYPLLLAFLSRFFPAQKIQRKKIRPTVSLIISCYNEEKVLREKLENSLALDYPRDRLEIIVVSDGSTDGTDHIAQEYSKKGVHLLRVEGRVGKTACLNVAVARASGEIVVFSDANAMYEPDAIIHLVENFADSQVGYVVGEARYADAAATAAAKSEDSYWQYEIIIKKMESRLYSMVGGDGAIYAIRRELYQNLEPSDINDFVNPLQIITLGYRGIYEPRAVCYEYTSGSFEKEFGRKARIVNRSFNGLFCVRSVMNPFKTGLYSLEIISHKLLRWFVPYFLLIFGGSTILLTVRGHLLFELLTLLIAVFLIFADIGHLLSSYSKIWPIFYLPYYFVRVNLAAFIGINHRLRGNTQVTWNPPRLAEQATDEVSLQAILVQVAVLGLAYYVFWEISRLMPVNLVTSRTIFWGAFTFIGYVYFVYPLVLTIWAKLTPRPVRREEIFPDLTLVICAYNEDEIIEEKIQNSLTLDYPTDRLQIVVASDGSTDRTNAIVEQYTSDRVQLYAYPERTGKIGAILQTVPQLRSDILIFSDANTMYAPDALRNLVRAFVDETVGGVSADVVILNEETSFGESESTYYRYERWIQEKESTVESIIGADGGMYAIRRNLFVPPSPNIILDDFVISMNVTLLGYRLVYDADAKGYERSTISHITEFLRKSRVIAGAVQALKQGEGIPGPSNKGLFFSFISHKLFRWFVPVMLISLLIATVYIVLHGGNIFYQAMLAGQALFYILALIGLCMGRESGTAVIGIPFYFCLVNAAALYGLYKGCLNKQPVTWKKFSRK